MYNKIVILGNLTKEIEMRFTEGGTAVANSAIASSRKFKTKDGNQSEETLFIDITFFGGTAQIAQKYLHKGSKILIEGKLKFDQWTDQTGQKRSKHSVIVENMQMLDSKPSYTDNPAVEQSSQKNDEEPIKEFETIDEENIPF